MTIIILSTPIAAQPLHHVRAVHIPRRAIVDITLAESKTFYM